MRWKSLRRENPETEAFFNGHADEPFFVKNLENVQGDERDAIFISIGYAPDKTGAFAMRFGPLSADGGERRLNVLITRAKKRCTVFSSITSDQINLERASGRGVAVLKDFLAYAAGGTSGAAADSQAEAADPFARAVQLALAKEGIETRARVGLSGLFLDLGVAAKEGGDFALGLAADSDFYVLAQGARDRDRQRDAALAMMGWKLARTWSPAWLSRPEAEARALADAARAAAGIAAPVVEQPGAATPAVPGLSVPYAPAVVEVPKDTPIPKVPFAALGKIVAAVVRAEVRYTRKPSWLACARCGAPRPMQKSAPRCSRRCGWRRSWRGFKSSGFWSAEDAAVTVRDRSALPAALRRAAIVPAAEWQAALLALARAAPATPRDQLQAGAVRLLGLDALAQGAAAARTGAAGGRGHAGGTGRRHVRGVAPRPRHGQAMH